MRTINEIIDSEDEIFRCFGDSMKNMLRVACPGIIQSFNSSTQTVTVQLALREQLASTKEWINIPILLDVPIVLPRSGGFCITMPIAKGDECLVVFADMCIDAWFSYGGIQNQIEKRRHDLSDAFAILGTWSQPRCIENYSINSCQIRNESGSSYVELKDSNITIKADSINLNSESVVISGIEFSTCKHEVEGKTSSNPLK